MWTISFNPLTDLGAIIPISQMWKLSPREMTRLDTATGILIFSSPRAAGTMRRDCQRSRVPWRTSPRIYLWGQVKGVGSGPERSWGDRGSLIHLRAASFILFFSFINKYILMVQIYIHNELREKVFPWPFMPHLPCSHSLSPPLQVTTLVSQAFF